MTSRRDFLTRSALAAGALTLGSNLRGAVSAAAPKVPLGKAEHCLFVWLGGGMSHIDTFDPKPTIGDPAAKKPGSYYPSIETAIPGVKVCEHLPEIAKIYDRFAPIRTINHTVID